MFAVAFFGQSDAAACPTIPPRPAWHAEAACRGQVDVFFAEGRGVQYAAARRLCASCPVRAECDLEGERLPSLWRTYGMRAGLSPEQRVRRRRVSTLCP